MKRRPDVLQLSANEQSFLLFRLAFSSEDSETGCREWVGGVNSKGYGTISVLGFTLYVHRVAFALHHGCLPAGFLVRHTCDNRRCLAESHLVKGTVLDNYNDMRTRGNAHAFGRRLLPRELSFEAVA